MTLPVTPSMVLQAKKRLQGVTIHTPTEPSFSLSRLTGCKVVVKWECLQRTGVFKLRGAYNKIAMLSSEKAAHGVITASTGNHGLAVAYAAKTRGIPAIIVVPKEASPLKVEKCERYGAQVVYYGLNYDEAASYSHEQAEETGASLIHAYADPLVIAGQGTVGVELLNDQLGTNTLLVPIGGGGLISGIALWAKTVNPQIRVIGIQSTATRAFYENYKAGKLFHVPIEPTIADGLAGNTSQVNLDFAKQFVDDVILVEEAKLREAIRWTLENEHQVLEPAGVVGIAALLQKKITFEPETHVAIIASGRNIDPTLLQNIFK
jgi:threonine dehydratase